MVYAAVLEKSKQVYIVWVIIKKNLYKWNVKDLLNIYKSKVYFGFGGEALYGKSIVEGLPKRAEPL